MPHHVHLPENTMPYKHHLERSHYFGHIQMRYLDYLANPDREKSPFPSNGRGKPCVKQSNRRLVNRDPGIAWRLIPSVRGA